MAGATGCYQTVGAVTDVTPLPLELTFVNRLVHTTGSGVSVDASTFTPLSLVIMVWVRALWSVGAVDISARFALPLVALTASSRSWRSIPFLALGFVEQVSVDVRRINGWLDWRTVGTLCTHTNSWLLAPTRTAAQLHSVRLDAVEVVDLEQVVVLEQHYDDSDVLPRTFAGVPERGVERKSVPPSV